LLSPNTYILDYNTIKHNVALICDEAARLGLTVYPMTKQLGRNPAIIELLKRMGLGKLVAVDWMGALQIAALGGSVGHVGHLVQVPKTETKEIAELRPEVWTVFSYEKAEEVSKALAGTDYTQNLLIRVWKKGDTFYPGHEGGIRLEELVETADKINLLSQVRVFGVTSFPCMLYNENQKKLFITKNFDTVIEAAELLRNSGHTVGQINTPGTTSTVTLGALAKKGATHVEPGHGMTGTTPAHAFDDLPEKPAMLFLSEVSHIHGEYAYFYGGGLYIDPVFSTYPVKAISGRDSDTIFTNRYEAKLPDPAGIDYYGMIKTGSAAIRTGDTVILGFRAQVFHTRGRVSVVEEASKGNPKVLGLWDANGRIIGS
jgi:predicted amino acid racemase